MNTTEKLLDNLVNAFLCWPVPKDFAPDAGISFNPGPTQHLPHCWPGGTNLFTADQAKAMLKHLFAQLPQDNLRASEEEGDAYMIGWFDGNASVPYNAPQPEAQPVAWQVMWDFPGRRVSQVFWHFPHFREGVEFCTKVIPLYTQPAKEPG